MNLAYYRCSLESINSLLQHNSSRNAALVAAILEAQSTFAFLQSFTLEEGLRHIAQNAEGEQDARRFLGHQRRSGGPLQDQIRSPSPISTSRDLGLSGGSSLQKGKDTRRRTDDHEHLTVIATQVGKNGFIPTVEWVSTTPRHCCLLLTVAIMIGFFMAVKVLQRFALLNSIDSCLDYRWTLCRLSYPSYVHITTKYSALHLLQVVAKARRCHPLNILSHPPMYQLADHSKCPSLCKCGQGLPFHFLFVDSYLALATVPPYGVSQLSNQATHDSDVEMQVKYIHTMWCLLDFGVVPAFDFFISNLQLNPTCLLMHMVLWVVC
jgi:hypothetical protein